MLAGFGLTICPACGKVVPVNTGFCVICDEVFPATVINAHVAEPAFELAEAA